MSPWLRHLPVVPIVLPLLAAADAPHTASTTTPSAAKQTRIPQRFSTKPTKTVKNAPESPIAAPLTPVASPLRLAYHFWAQASTAGAKKALPTPAGMLYTKKNNAALPCGTSAAPMLPPAVRPKCRSCANGRVGKWPA